MQNLAYLALFFMNHWSARANRGTELKRIFGRIQNTIYIEWAHLYCEKNYKCGFLMLHQIGISPKLLGQECVWCTWDHFFRIRRIKLHRKSRKRTIIPEFQNFFCQIWGFWTGHNARWCIIWLFWHFFHEPFIGQGQPWYRIKENFWENN